MSKSSRDADAAPSKYALLAQEHGLPRQKGRPPFRRYMKDVWQARNFIWTLAKTRTYARNENTYLGQVWSILTPLLYAAVYFLIFGVVLDTRDGIDNFVGFLVAGLFVYQFCSSALSQGAVAVVRNLSMIRSLRFPRAALPISVVITELLTLLPAIVVMFGIVWITGETPQWQWLLTLPTFALITLFNVGVALFTARLVSQYRDVKNLIPFVVQLLRYLSGLFFSIAAYTAAYPALGLVMQYQPYALSLDLVRGNLLAEASATLPEVLVMCAWAVVALVGGTIYFWRREGKYGVE